MPKNVINMKDPNLTDTNGAPGVMDEDGEFDFGDGAEVNEAPEGDDEEEDISPPVHGLTLKTTHVGGKEYTEITANITAGAAHDVDGNILTSGGLVSKRLVVPGQVTARQLAEHLYNMASW